METFVRVIVSVIVMVVSVFAATLVFAHVATLGASPLIAYCIAIVVFMLASSVITAILNITAYAATLSSSSEYAVAM